MANESASLLREKLNKLEQDIQGYVLLGNSGMARVLTRQANIISRKLDQKK